MHRFRGVQLYPGDGDPLHRDHIVLHSRIMSPRYFQRLGDGTVRLHFNARTQRGAIFRLKPRH